MDNAYKPSRLTVDIDPAIKRKLKMIAAMKDMTMRELIMEALFEKIEAYGQEILNESTKIIS